MQIQNFDVFTLGIGRVIASGYAMKNCISFLLTAYLKPMQWVVKNGVQFRNIHAINFELRDKFLSQHASEFDFDSLSLLEQFAINEQLGFGNRMSKDEVDAEFDGEKIWWDDEKQEYNTIDYAVAKQWKNRLHTLREKSVAGINFSDALDTVITRDEYRSLSDEKQRELIQAWLYPTNDDGEIDDGFDEETDEKVEQWYRDRASIFTFHSFAPYCSMCFRDNPSYVGITENGTPFEFCRQCRNELKRKKDEMLTPPERFGA